MPLKKSKSHLENKERGIRAKARIIAKNIYGETAIKNKDVHHKDGNNKNNKPSNLSLRKHDSHAKSHGRGHGKKGNKSIK
jgi:hypothetical protein